MNPESDVCMGCNPVEGVVKRKLSDIRQREKPYTPSRIHISVSVHGNKRGNVARLTRPKLNSNKLKRLERDKIISEKRKRMKTSLEPTPDLSSSRFDKIEIYMVSQVFCRIFIT